MKNVKKRLRPIPKSMRGKKRYLLFEIISDKKFTEVEIKEALFRIALQLFGEFGLARQKLWLVKWLPAKNLGIVRCALECIEEVKTEILFINEISGYKVIPNTILTSGTIAKLKAKL